MRPRRCSGILCHVTSLPSRFGIGDLGPAARRFVEFLHATHQGRWQILPLNPTSLHMGNSPYTSDSAFAGEPLVISPEQLVEDGCLEWKDSAHVPRFPTRRVDFPRVRRYKAELLERAWQRCRGTDLGPDYQRFFREHAAWIDDYALFLALKDRHGQRSWQTWPRPLHDREPRALERAAAELAEPINRVRFWQYLFHRQWAALRAFCHARNIHLVGDLPYYLAYDSADVWAHPDLFKLDQHKRPAFVAGCPPDYFCKTGQLWGNPVYNWRRCAETGYDWWLRRMQRNFRLYDLVRIDHFRGLLGTWQVPAGAKTAAAGHWVTEPQDAFMDLLLRQRPYVPIIAEDLGEITPDVREMMWRYDLPGLRVLQFAFDESMPANPHAPHNHVPNCVAYPGTHDNDTIRGWFERELSAADKRRLFAYVGRQVPAREIAWEMIRLAMLSVANTAIVPLQDVLSLGAAARMNRPGSGRGNWEWRLEPAQLTPRVRRQLADLTIASGRA